MEEEPKSLFAETLGDTPPVRILDFLLENRMSDFTKSEIAEGAKVSRVTLEKFWLALERAGIVTETRRIGNGILFTLNGTSPLVKKFLELDDLLTKMETEKIFLGGKANIPLSA
jgi:DNA-binding transcriptional ArsR family regulator